MAKSLYHIPIGALIGTFLVFFVLPYAAGFLAYTTTYSGGVAEQTWLDTTVDHLRTLRSECTDPELKEVLDYTIRRYNRIGPFDVAVSRCDWYDWFSSDYYTLGLNNPLVSGITIDLSVVSKHSIHSGAVNLVHEALHDYPPYLGHQHITPIIDKLENLHAHRQRNCSSS